MTEYAQEPLLSEVGLRIYYGKDNEQALFTIILLGWNAGAEPRYAMSRMSQSNSNHCNKLVKHHPKQILYRSPTSS